MFSRKLKLKAARKYQLIPSVILILNSFIMIFPFVWMLLSAFKTTADVSAYPPQWIPSEWHYENFGTVFKRVPFVWYYINSIITAGGATILTVIISLFAAYAISKLHFPGKNIINIIFRACMFIPGIVLIIPQYFMVFKAGLADTYAGIILPQILSGFAILMLKVLVDEIPDELIEASYIDGCDYGSTLFKIILPNCKTAVATASLYVFVQQWGSYLWPLMVTTKTQMRTLMIGLKYLMSDNGAGLEYEIMMAAASMAIIPVFLLYLRYEKELVKSMVMTGIK